jgi:hypothetical protein
MVFAPLPTRKPRGISNLKKRYYGFFQSRQVSGEVVPEIRLSFFISPSDFFLPIHCRSRWLFLCLTSNNDTNTLSRNPMHEGSVSCRDSVPVNTQHS